MKGKANLTKMGNVVETVKERCYWLASGETLEHPAAGCEVFKYVPRLLSFMERLWNEYENFDAYEWNDGATKEKAYEKYMEMYLCFRNLCNVDLQIIWYLHSGMFSSVHKILTALQKAYDAKVSAFNSFEMETENPLTSCERVLKE